MACGAKPNECDRGGNYKSYIRNDSDPHEESSVLVYFIFYITLLKT